MGVYAWYIGNDCYIPAVYQEKVDVWQKPGIWLVYTTHTPGTYQIGIFVRLQIGDVTSQQRKPNFYTAKNLLSSFELKLAYLKWMTTQIA